MYLIASIAALFSFISSPPAPTMEPPRNVAELNAMLDLIAGGQGAGSASQDDQLEWGLYCADLLAARLTLCDNYWTGVPAEKAICRQAAYDAYDLCMIDVVNWKFPPSYTNFCAATYEQWKDYCRAKWGPTSPTYNPLTWAQCILTADAWLVDCNAIHPATP